MYLIQSQSKICVKYSSCRVSGQKSKLGYRYTDIGTIKVKTETEKERIKLGIFGPAHCSLYLFCSQERERKKLIPLLFFLPSHCNTLPLFPLGNHKFVLYDCEYVSISQTSSFVLYFTFQICDIIWYLSFLSGLLHLVW